MTNIFRREGEVLTFLYSLMFKYIIGIQKFDNIQYVFFYKNLVWQMGGVLLYFEFKHVIINRSFDLK